VDDSFVSALDDEDDILQFTDRLTRGQHTSKEILSLKLLKLLRAIGAPNYSYCSIMDVSSATSAVSSTFRQRDTTIKHFANWFRLHKLVTSLLCWINSWAGFPTGYNNGSSGLEVKAFFDNFYGIVAAHHCDIYV
jgi:hypothetical protein